MANEIQKETTLAEILRHNAPDGSLLKVIDVLAEDNSPLIEEGVWVPANDNTSHEFLQTVSEPKGAVVGFNKGAPFDKGVEKPVKEQIMRFGSNLKINVDVLKHAKDPVQYRRNQEAMTVRGLKKTFCDIVFAKNGMGDPDLDPEQIPGLGHKSRFGALAAGSVVSLGGSGADLDSLWLVKRGFDGLFFIHPMNVAKTLVVEDKTAACDQMIPDENGNPQWFAITNFDWSFGMGIGNPRNVKRLCNIAASGAGSFFEDTKPEKGENALIDLIEGFDTTDDLVIYAGPKMMAQFRKRLNSKGNLYFNENTVWGRKAIHFQDIPVIKLPCLRGGESAVV